MRHAWNWQLGCGQSSDETWFAWAAWQGWLIDPWRETVEYLDEKCAPLPQSRVARMYELEAFRRPCQGCVMAWPVCWHEAAVHHSVSSHQLAPLPNSSIMERHPFSAQLPRGVTVNGGNWGEIQGDYHRTSHGSAHRSRACFDSSQRSSKFIRLTAILLHVNLGNVRLASVLGQSDHSRSLSAVRATATPSWCLPHPQPQDFPSRLHLSPTHQGTSHWQGFMLGQQQWR
jgi:hypothetical protein